MLRVPYIPVLLLYGVVSTVHLLPAVLPRVLNERVRLIAALELMCLETDWDHKFDQYSGAKKTRQACLERTQAQHRG